MGKTTLLANLLKLGVTFGSNERTYVKLRVRGRNVGKFKKLINDLIAKHSGRKYEDWERALNHLVENLTFRIEGPTEEQVQDFSDLGFSVARYRCSWIGFFRIVDDNEQIRPIDKWLRRQVKSYVWKKFGVKVSSTELKIWDCLHSFQQFTSTIKQMNFVLGLELCQPVSSLTSSISPISVVKFA